MYHTINKTLNISQNKYGEEYMTQKIWPWMYHKINMMLNVSQINMARNVSQNKCGAKCITQ